MKPAIALALMAPTFACAEFLSGNDLLQRLKSPEIVMQMSGLGYVMGVFDVTQTVAHCAPNDAGVSAGQVRDMTKIWLEQNPVGRNQSADRLVVQMLSQVWPCRGTL